MTKAEREALEALAESYRCSMSLEVAACGEELRTILAALDKPATRYPWADAPEWAMWAATDRLGVRSWFGNKPRLNIELGWWLSGMAPEESIKGRAGNASDWSESLERRPDAP